MANVLFCSVSTCNIMTTVLLPLEITFGFNPYKVLLFFLAFMFSFKSLTIFPITIFQGSHHYHLAFDYWNAISSCYGLHILVFPPNPHKWNYFLMDTEILKCCFTKPWLPCWLELKCPILWKSWGIVSPTANLEELCFHGIIFFSDLVNSPHHRNSLGSC